MGKGASRRAIGAAERTLDLGCHKIVTRTGIAAVLGDPQHSYKNTQKIGFRED